MRKIEVSETGNPTPDRSQDYCAVFDGYDGAPDAGHQCMGMGHSREEAINNLRDCCELSEEVEHICNVCQTKDDLLPALNICYPCARDQQKRY